MYTELCDGKKIWIDLIVIVACLICVAKLADFLLVDYNSYYSLLFYGYDSADSIDNVFVGNSHIYSGIDPITLDSINESVNFNFSTPAQRADSSYYFIKDIAENKGVSRIFLECYPFIYSGSSEYADFTYTDDARGRAWSESYYLQPSLLKYEILANAAPLSEYFIESLFPFTRYRMHACSNGGAVLNNIRSKLSYNRFHHLADDGYEKYYKKGFSPSYNCLENNELYFVKTRNFNIDRLGKESEEYLRKTLEFCNNNEIDVSIIVMPLYELEVISYENYDNYHNLLKSVADEYDTPVYDFNYIRGDVFDTQNRSFYRNVDHLNTVGAEVFTPIMWSAVCASPEEKEEYFYSSYEEKREKEPLKVFGVYHEDSDDTLDRCTIACNRTNGAEFKISLVDEFGNIIESIQDYDDNRCFYLPKGEKCSVLIESRVKQEPIEACIIDVGI